MFRVRVRARVRVGVRVRVRVRVRLRVRVRVGGCERESIPPTPNLVAQPQALGAPHALRRAAVTP